MLPKFLIVRKSVEEAVDRMTKASRGNLSTTQYLEYLVNQLAIVQQALEAAQNEEKQGLSLFNRSIKGIQVCRDSLYDIIGS